MKALLRFAEKGFTILAMLLFSGAVLVAVRRASGFAQTDSDPLFQVIWFGIYAITFCLLAVRLKGFTRIPSNLDWPILLLTGFAVLSFYWSIMPDWTLRRSIALLGTTLFGVYLGTRYSPREQLRLLAWTLGIAAVLSLLFALLLPSYGLDTFPFQGAWRGVYQQKNLLGRYMTLSSLVFLLIALSNYRHRWVMWSAFGLSAGLILLSTSKTSLLVFIILLTLLPLYRALRWSYTFSIPLFIVAILIFGSLAIVFTFEAETILSAIGKDATLTGRTDLWNAVLKASQQHPWLGYGYSTFWFSLEAYYLRLEIYWSAPHSHNGFLDLGLDLGILGVLIFAISFLNSFFKALIWARHNQTLEDLWPIAFLTFMFLFNLTQSSILARNELVWVIYVAINCSNPLERYRYRPANLVIDTIPKQREWSKNA